LVLTSKQPLATPLAALSFTAGSFSDYRGDLDLSGPLNEDKSVRYRLNVSYQNFGSFRDFVNGERFIFSPAIAWDISPNTTLNFYGQYARNRETLDEGTIATENGIINLPRNRFLGEPFSEFSQDQFTLGYRLDHRFDQNWSARHALEYLAYSPRRYAPLFDGFDPNTGELSRLAYFAGGNYRRIFTNAEVTGKFDTGSIQHQVLLGVEYRNTIEKPEFQFSNSYNSINIFNPVYTRTPYAISPEFFRDDTINTVGIYVQDQITLLPNLKLLLGGRYDFINQFRTTRVIDAARREFAQSDSAFSPRVGIVYQPIEPLSIYTAYNRSFRAGFGAARNSDGSTFRPETGEQLEIGAKFDITPRLNLTLAAFDLKKQNVRTPDPNNPRFSLQTGEVTSRGIELNLGGEILPGWNITSSYNYLDTFVSRDNRNIVGNRFANVPSNQFSLWSSYTIQQGDLEGLGFGLGLFYVSDRPGNNDNTFSIPSYFRTDAAIFYKRDNWKAQLNIENLFDANYFTSSDQFLGVIRGRPLAVSGRFSVEF
jgi:iron complex outermembrane receptor protein